jgi:hypothetical protein
VIGNAVKIARIATGEEPENAEKPSKKLGKKVLPPKR